MADENELGQGAEGEVIAAPVIEEGREAKTQPDADPVEELARDMGWRPQDEFKGDPERWRPARDFIKEGREIQRSLSSELKQVRTTVEDMARASAAMTARELAERDAHWEARFNEAVEAGDPEGARHAVAQRQSLVTAAPQATQSRTAFKERNPWFDTDASATRRAVELAGSYAQMGKTPTEQIELVEKDMRRERPDLYPEQKQAKPAPQVEAPASRQATTGKRVLGFNDMPVEHQKYAKELVSGGQIASTDAYVANWRAMQAEKGQRQ